MFEKIMNAFSKKAEQKQEQDLTQLKESLMKIVYDAELVEELAPVIAKLQTVDGFDKVWGLVEAKEQQIEALAKQGYWTQQQSDDSEQQQDTSDSNQGNEDDGVNSLIQQKYTK